MEWNEHWDSVNLPKLYTPDPTALDLDAHIAEAVAWCKRAQDAGEDRGISWGVKLGSDFQPSYPETTGYICQTFVDLWRRTGDQELLNRAMSMGEWEADIQMPEGAVMGGQFNHNPTPAVFNTGMVLLGWAALIRATGNERMKAAATRAGEWLLRMQDADGNWRRGNSDFADGEATVYNVKSAWGLCEAGQALGRQDFVQGAIRNAEYCLSCQNANGWYRNCCLSDATQPLLHTVAYTMQGLFEIGRLTGRKDFIEAARKTADAEMRIMDPDGFLPGRQDSEFRGTVPWCCLTGSAQTSIVWSDLYELTGEQKYRDAAVKINGYLMARHDIRNPDPRIRGGMAGSWPVEGDYGKLHLLNWAAKFLVDALVRRKYQTSPARN